MTRKRRSCRGTGHLGPRICFSRPTGSIRGSDPRLDSSNNVESAVVFLAQRYVTWMYWLWIGIDASACIWRRLARAYDEKGLPAPQRRLDRKYQRLNVGCAGQICRSYPRVRRKLLSGQIALTRDTTRVSRVMIRPDPRVFETSSPVPTRLARF